MEAISAFAIGLLITLTLMLALRPIAFAVGLVDIPGGRKSHAGAVPVVGGIAMFLGSIGAVLAVGLSGKSESALIVASALMVLVGALDDRFDLAPYARILAQIAAAMTLVMATGHTVENFGDLLGFGVVSLGSLKFIFTVVAAMALVNGFNMLDGLDGLAGGSALIALCGLSYFFFGSDHTAAAVLSMGLVGSIVGFLVFNLPAAYNRPLLTFMGDAGSTLLGFALAGLSLIAIQPGGERLPPVVVLWLLPVPILELFTSTVRRIVTGLPPMQADRGHFHHRLLDAGFSVRAIFILYFGVSAISAVSGLWAWRLGASESALFYSFVALSAVWLVCMYYARRLAARLPESLKRLEFPPHPSGHRRPG